MSNLPDNYFRRFTPAELIAAIAASQPTLAQLSLENAGELERIGWANNPIVDILYSLTSAGVWIAKTDAYGRVSDGAAYANSNWLQRLAMAAVRPTFADTNTDDTVAGALRRIGYKDITLAGGSAADQELVPKVAGYYGVMRVLALGSNTPDTYTWTFQDEDNTLLAGGVSGVLMPEITAAHVPVNLYPGYVFTQATKTDNKALEVDVTGGAGAEHVIIIYEYWYET